MNVKEAVDNGEKWLDENYPGWDREVALDRFDLNDCSNCVIGQITGEEWGGRPSIAGFKTFDEFVDWSDCHGFSGSEFIDLQAEWVRRIRYRKEQGE